MRNRLGLITATVLTIGILQAARAQCPELCGDKFNTAFGGALPNVTTGLENTVVGTEAMQLTRTGSQNVAMGAFAALGMDGNGNVALGDKAMTNSVEGNDNVAVGYAALNNCTGTNNIGIGVVGGVNLTDGSHNIIIGTPGHSNDDRIIRIGGRKTHRRTFLAGISGVTVADGVTVVVNDAGQLGTLTSSARYKEAIKPMNEASEAILSLEPVSFRYKKDLDPKGIPQFGLVAEDVAKIDPDLVARDESGRPYGVRYEAVNAMLLNEFLKEHAKVDEQGSQLEEQAKEIAKLKAALAGQANVLQRVLARLQATDS